MKKIIRTSTVPESLNILLKGQLSFLNQFFNVIAVSGEGIHLQEVSSREKVKTSVVEMKRQISLINDLISLIKLYFLFRKETPTIVHSITPKAGLLTMLAGKMAGVPIRIHTFTGLVFPSKRGFMKRLLIIMDRLLCRASTHIYPEGEGVKKDLINYKITKKPLQIIANGNINGIDIEFFDPKQINEDEKKNIKKRLNIKEGDFVFIFVGRLVGDKGINELILAFQKIKEQVENNVKLLLVGQEEPKLDPLRFETLKNIREDKSIITVGYQKEVRLYFSIADCLVFPSYREGFPNVILQAGAMGLPSIVTDISGCNEIIINNKNGLIIPPKNLLLLQEAMLKISSDQDLFLKMKASSREMVVTRYKQELVWEELLKEYKRLEENV
ncbi:glycosyltransferase family 4 protein [Flavobacterium oreochromis]|uniref:Glycosyltransferase family 4 protein n=1 Tax=Flavobacterium oreochromis TaxID=2906078 RepID=A0ABW8P7S9_9FLAO|nr:glycosyltransferase family 4 protein [Flavobacterium oreochromis]OWP77587.1 glycosyltransferase family 1 protein [Flavobacterium oreochromis]